MKRLFYIIASITVIFSFFTSWLNVYAIEPHLENVQVRSVPFDGSSTYEFEGDFVADQGVDPSHFYLDLLEIGNDLNTIASLGNLPNNTHFILPVSDEIKRWLQTVPADRYSLALFADGATHPIDSVEVTLSGNLVSNVQVRRVAFTGGRDGKTYEIEGDVAPEAPDIWIHVLRNDGSLVTTLGKVPQGTRHFLIPSSDNASLRTILSNVDPGSYKLGIKRSPSSNAPYVQYVDVNFPVQVTGGQQEESSETDTQTTQQEEVIVSNVKVSRVDFPTGNDGKTYRIEGDVKAGAGDIWLHVLNPSGNVLVTLKKVPQGTRHFSLPVDSDTATKTALSHLPSGGYLLGVKKSSLANSPYVQQVNIVLPQQGTWEGGTSQESGSEGDSETVEENEEESLNHTVHFSLLKDNSYAFYEDRNTGKIVWGLNIEGGGFSRDTSETVYLVLRRGDGVKKTLCKFEGGGGNAFPNGPNFPACYSKNPDLLFKSDGKTYGKIDILDPSKKIYFVYFSSDVNGERVVSNQLRLHTFKPALKGIVKIDEEKITGKGKKKRYELRGKVEEDGQGVLIFSLYKNGSSVAVPYGSIPFKKGTTFQLPTQEASSQFTGLQPGTYLLKVQQLLDPHGDAKDAILRQVIPLKNPIPDENKDDKNGPSSNEDLGVDYTASQQDVLNNGIVPTDCGYNLGKGGRMCTLNDFMRLIKRVIDYIFILMIPIGALVTAYAGYLILTSGGDTGKVKRARDAGWALLKGIGLFMLAWLIIKAIIDALGVSSNFNIFFGS